MICCKCKSYIHIGELYLTDRDDDPYHASCYIMIFGQYESD
jgi:hypothetical protein